MLKCINERYILLLKKKKIGCILIPRATIKQALTGENNRNFFLAETRTSQGRN